MSSSGKKDKNTYPIWWEEPQNADITALWQEAVEDYLECYDVEVDEVKFGIDLVKKMIPNVAGKDKRWKRFPKDSFNTGQYEAHAKLYETINNKLKSLKKMAEKQREDEAA